VNVRRFVACVAAVAAALAAPSAAGADDDATTADERFTLGGRVFVREQVESREAAPATGEASLRSARLSLKYRWKKRLRAEVTVEAAGGKASLRDATLQLSLGDGFWVRGGCFKLPLSVIELTSTWTLPTVDRGFLHDVLGDGLQITGRRVGLAFGWQGQGEHAPAFELGAYQSLDLAGDSAAGPLDDGAGLTFAARASLALPPGLVVGIFGSSRDEQVITTTAAAHERFWAAGADLALDLSACGCGLRAWADAVAGSTPLDTTPATPASPTFVSARATLAWRHGGEHAGARYLEPFASGAVIDPNLDNAHDAVWSASVGVNLGRWRRYRVGLELEHRESYASRPSALGGAGDDLADRDAATVQLGAAF
jgi:hypothetical protein